MAKHQLARSSSDQTEKLMRIARDQGWVVEQTKGGHVLFMPADKKFGPIFTSSTPSDWRSEKNLRSRLRRAGLKVE